MKWSYLFFVLLFTISCDTEDYKTKILGQWTVDTWIVQGSNEAIQGYKMDFDFKSDFTYVLDYGDEKEKGTYSFGGDKLFTKETGMSEKSVKIVKLTIDSFKIEMNRAGRIEEVLLVKK